MFVFTLSVIWQSWTVAKKLSYFILNTTVTKNNGRGVTQGKYYYESAMAS